MWRQMWENFGTIIKQNLLLFDNPLKLLKVTAIRLTALVVLVLLLKIILLWDGAIPLDTLHVTSVLLALFAVGLSCAFYFKVNRAAQESQAQLLQFLSEKRPEQRTGAEEPGPLSQADAGMKEAIDIEVAGAALERARKDRSDVIAEFQAMEMLIETHLCQLLVLMRRFDQGLPVDGENASFWYAWQQENRESGMGTLSTREILRKLENTELLFLDNGNEAVLTTKGEQFADWLSGKQKIVDFFYTNFGGWGEPDSEFQEYLTGTPFFQKFWQEPEDSATDELVPHEMEGGVNDDLLLQEKEEGAADDPVPIDQEE